MRTIAEEHFVEHVFRPTSTSTNPTSPSASGRARKGSTWDNVIGAHGNGSGSGRLSSSGAGDVRRSTDTMSDREKDLQVQLAASQVRRV